MVTINYKETKTVDVFLPEVEMRDKMYNVGFLVFNLSKYQTDFILTRRKICNCVKEVQTQGLSKTKTVFNCIHRKMLDMRVLKEDLVEVVFLLFALTICLKNNLGQ